MTFKAILLVVISVVAIFWLYQKIVGKVEGNSMLQNDDDYHLYLNKELLSSIKNNYPELKIVLKGKELVSENGLIITTSLVNHRQYPESETFQINYTTQFNNQFPKGIEERLVGIGTDAKSALSNGVQSFIQGQFPVIMDGLNLRHQPELDIDIIGDNGKTHWHPVTGSIQLQGDLATKQDSLIYEKMYKLLSPMLLKKLKNSNQDFHWFRYYIGKIKEEDAIGDCYFDNEYCEECMGILKAYTLTWEKSDFSGQKQFILFRKCGE